MTILTGILIVTMLSTGCGNGRRVVQQSGEPSENLQTEGQKDSEEPLRIRVETDTQSILFQLNDSPAAKSLFDQLPLTLTVENYSNNEKIFYPPEALDVTDTPLAEGPAGTLAYYEPWGDVAIFYGACGGASGLYELGEAISGAEQIESLSGEIRIEKFSEDSSEITQGKQESEGETGGEENTTMKMNVQVGDSTFTATLENNAAVDAFVKMMDNGPVVIQMSDYSGFEKVGPLGANLPASNSQITTQAGDIVLYNGNQIVIFYGSNSWSYTKLGKIDDLSGWEEALGSGDVTVAFSVA